MEIRPVNDWILVKVDPVEKQIGSILIPGGVDHRKATVLATGPGRDMGNGMRAPTGVKPNERIVFNRAHAEHLQGKQLLSMLGEERLLLKPEDILFVMDEEVQVE